MLLQLDPTIPLDTPRGRAWAYFLLDLGQDHELLWITFVRETGECWTFRNPQVRLVHNETMGTRCASSQKEERMLPGILSIIGKEPVG